jgi:hypothetical protein
MDYWHPQAERLHGISPKMLSELGVNATAACERVTRALSGCVVYSDAPDWDAFWLMRLFDAAGRRPTVKLKDFSTLMPAMPESRKGELLARADRLAPRRHRAAEDALHLVTIYRLAIGADGV